MVVFCFNPQLMAVTDAGLPSLAELPALWKLNLYTTGVGDEGLKTLSEVS